MKNDSPSSNGFGVLGVLQIIFVVLKLMNLIELSWWKIFIPSYIAVGIVVLTIVIFKIFGWKIGD